MSYSWPKVGDIVRHTQSKRVVKVLRVGDTIDARTANATDAHPDYPNVSPVDLDEANNEDRVRFILAEMKTGKVLIVGNSKNDRKFTVTFEDEPTPELVVNLSKAFASVSPKGKAVDLILKTEPPVEAAPQTVTMSPEAKAELKAEFGLTDADFESDEADETAADKDALIAELEARIEKLNDRIDDLRDERDSAIAMADAADQRVEDFAERDDLSAFPLVRCMEVVTLYVNTKMDRDREKFDADLAKYVSAGWTKFDSGIIPGIEMERFVTLVHVQSAPQPSERKAAQRVIENAATLAETRATLTAMADDPSVGIYEFNRMVLASRLTHEEKQALTIQRRQLVGQQIAARRPASPRYPAHPFRVLPSGAQS